MDPRTTSDARPATATLRADAWCCAPGSRNLWGFFLIALAALMALSFSGLVTWNIWPYIGALAVAFAGFGMLRPAPDAPETPPRTL